MRFWRRNVPTEPTPATEESAPEPREREQDHSHASEVVTEERPPQPPPEPQADAGAQELQKPPSAAPITTAVAGDDTERQGWFWRRHGTAQPTPENAPAENTPAETDLGRGETALRAPEVEEQLEQATPPAVIAGQASAEMTDRWGWLWRRQDRSEPAHEPEEGPPEPDDAAPELEQPAPEPEELPLVEEEPQALAPAKEQPAPEDAPELGITMPEARPSEPSSPEARSPEPSSPEEVLAAFRRVAPEPEAPQSGAPEAVQAPAPESADQRGWFARLRAGLSRSSTRLNEGINAIFLRRRLDDEALEELEELLIASDMGVGIAGEVAESLRSTRFNQEVAPEEVRVALADQVIRLIEPVTRPLRVDRRRKPFVILVIGVNGSGKTTTIAKLAKQYRDQGMSVVLAAGDTFRAAAVEQLQIWGERVGCPVVTRPAGSDAAGLAYDALVQAKDASADVLLIDTAGRLHNKADLMDELKKIVRVLKKVDAESPHSVLLVLDATTGQNAHAQAETFRDMIGVTGIVMTKLDGTARGGVLVSLAEKYGIPIHAIGVGETADDLRPFEARAYARSLVGLEP